ncbi:hypothetical protein V8E36_006957 [Tilletia maclaganii]
MDAHERIRRELEEDERLDAIDPLRHLLQAGDRDEETNEERTHLAQDRSGEQRSGDSSTATGHDADTRGAPAQSVTARALDGKLRYKLNDGNDLVPAQRAAVEGELRAVVRYFSPRSASAPTKAPITFGLADLGKQEQMHDNSSSSGEAAYEYNFHDVHLHQDVANGCGGRIWPAAEVLGAYLARDPERWRTRWAGKDVLELGSGTGLLGLLCARMGLGKRVFITDQDAMIKLLQRNLELNEEVAKLEGRPGLLTACAVAELNWGECLPATVPPKPEVLLLADCVYLETAFQPLVDTMVELSSATTEILFCYQKRRKADKRFFTLLKKHFDFEHVADDDPAYREQYHKEGTQLLSVIRRERSQ